MKSSSVATKRREKQLSVGSKAFRPSVCQNWMECLWHAEQACHAHFIDNCLFRNEPITFTNQFSWLPSIKKFNICKVLIIGANNSMGKIINLKYPGLIRSNNISLYCKKNHTNNLSTNKTKTTNPTFNNARTPQKARVSILETSSRMHYEWTFQKWFEVSLFILFSLARSDRKSCNKREDGNRC